MPPEKIEGTGEPSPLEKLQKQYESLANENTELKKNYVNVQSAFNKRDVDIRTLREQVDGLKKAAPKPRAERFEADETLPEDDPYVQHLRRELDTRDQRNERMAQRLAEATFIQEIGSKTVMVEGKPVTVSGKDYIARMEKIADENPRRASYHSFRNADGTVDYDRSLKSFYQELRNEELEARDKEAAKQAADEAANRRRTASTAVISGDDVVPEGEVLDLTKLGDSADDLLDLLDRAGLVDKDSPPSRIGDSTKK
jgi:hypothetical protein